MRGEAGTMDSGPDRKHLNAHVPSRFEVLRHDPGLEGWFEIVGWFAGTTVAVWSFWRDLGKPDNVS
jgi:hypothetical protein